MGMLLLPLAKPALMLLLQPQLQLNPPPPAADAAAAAANTVAAAVCSAAIT
jgi:hypothetical protein